MSVCINVSVKRGALAGLRQLLLRKARLSPGVTAVPPFICTAQRPGVGTLADGIQ